LAKKARVYDGTAWQELASAQTDLTAYSTTAQMNTAITAGVGLTLINTTTFSAAASVQVDNCFTTTYDSYKINLRVYGSVGQYPRLQLCSGGTANTSSYSYGANFFDSGGNNAISNYGSGAYGEIPYIGTTSTVYSLIEFQVDNPALALATNIRGNGLQASTARNFFVHHSTASAYDGIKIYANSGNITGTIRIYGYKN
jgi:hypothetical protein